MKSLVTAFKRFLLWTWLIWSSLWVYLGFYAFLKGDALLETVAFSLVIGPLFVYQIAAWCMGPVVFAPKDKQ
jgi:hypothetical protein